MFWTRGSYQTRTTCNIKVKFEPTTVPGRQFPVLSELLTFIECDDISEQYVNLDNNLHEHVSINDRISEIFPDTNVHAISVDYEETPSKRSLLKNKMTSHGLAMAILHAYNNHQHLRLSPDDIWLTIAQGVSHHINYNAEKFRYYFVNHEGKKEISISVDDILTHNISRIKGDWPEAVNRLVVKTDQAVEKMDIKSLLECDFSTTTKNSLTASRIVLLDMVKAYFSYKMHFCCGIPKVTLEGTLEDWEKVQEKVIQLRRLNLDLDFWLDRLEPVICKLIETYKGEVDEVFWSMIASQRSFGSGPSNISGWMMAFYPYEKNGTKLTRDSIEPYEIPDGRVAVPFTTNTGLCLKFIAGFLGAQQEFLENSNEVVVSPVIGWFVIDDKTAEEDDC
ncbi:15547_t:CDS:2 [Funneliformis mosseae]|uniref:15547_t:CDS:1 n=1 Tax=Funneliformis mosseae TaxID=27381 RepID=A0A9N9BJT9_FUNMO|nr:15547_t:CDS:2 [Funneliformis mosseae]